MNTLHKEYRSRLIVSMGILTLFVLVIENYLMNHFSFEAPFFQPDGSEPQNPAEAKLAIFYSIITIWSSFLAALIGINTVRSDIDFKVLPQLLSLPVSRLEYLTARTLGAFFMVLGYYLASIAAAILFFNTQTGPLRPSLEITSHLLITSSLFPVYIIAGIAFSLYLNRIMAFLSTMILLALSSLANRFFTMQDLTNLNLSDLDIFSFFGLVLHLFLPRIEHLRIWADAVSQGAPAPISPPLLLVHYALSLAFLFWLTYMAFRKREV